MKYLCLIYDEEKTVAGMSKAEGDAFMGNISPSPLLGDFDRAEEAMHDAFAAAVEQWPREGVPANPRAWLVSTGRFKAIDSIRRRA